ncbi:MAG: hypothetical protein Kapaf2KO_19380 [Candidatus Kapaibacteriales bacterium]
MLDKVKAHSTAKACFGGIHHKGKNDEVPINLPIVLVFRKRVTFGSLAEIPEEE